MKEDFVQIPERVVGVRAAIAAAAEKCGRDPSAVTLMAVVKTRQPEEIAAIVEAGVTVLGENRVQEGQAHLAALSSETRSKCDVHFIGRLQANKARKALLSFDAVDGVDSEALARRLSRIAAEEGIERTVLIEVNLGEESQKGGVEPEGALALSHLVQSLPGLRLAGLMGVPPLAEDPEAGRPFFKLLAGLFERARQGHPKPEEFRLLSMGMSHDFTVAVEEGATLVRVGTALFGPRRQ
jgi:pyridoxal phosphate enzyme (YggS family)